MEPCQYCGYAPCTCQEQLDAYYSLYPEEEPTMCGECGNVYNAGSLHEGLCDRCWYVNDRDDEDDYDDELYG